MFFPRNTTAVLQPCDAGINYAFKRHYRNGLLKTIISHLDEGKIENKEQFTVSLLSAILLMRDAWRQITKPTIMNCFRKTGLSKSESVQDETDIFVVESHKMQELLSQLYPEEVIDVNDYVLIDNTVVTNYAATDEKITEEIQAGENEEVIEVDDQNDPPEHISVKSALTAHDILNKFFVQEDYASDEITLTVIGTVLKKMRTEKTKQTNITDFFVH